MEKSIVQAHAKRAFDCVKSGGAVIMPLDVAYSICSHTPESVERVMQAKRRTEGKVNGSPGTLALSSEIHLLPQKYRDAIRAVTVDHNLPLTVCAPFRRDHPYIRAFDPRVLERSTKDDTISMIINGGEIAEELVTMCADALLPIVGSSANVSLQGTKYTLESVEPEVRSAAELHLDTGMSKYANDDGLATTILHLPDLQVIRFGLFYDKIRDVFTRDFGLQLPSKANWVHREQLAALAGSQA
jgi:tRNA A37 threonylcarbamoyladenosine synthetase subunit TsaC/SUA5/YrdC